jgi:PAS domain S-box-containing protein
LANSEEFDAQSGSGVRVLTDLQLILETTGVGMWTYDSGSNTFTLDATCRQLFDLDDDEELNFDTLQRKLHPDDIAGYWEAAKQSLEDGTFSVNYRVCCGDGSIRFISGRGRLMPTMPGKAAITKGVCIDVTEQRQLETQLKVTEERMQQLADNVPGLFSYIDKNYRVQFMSSLYRQIFSRSRPEILNQHIGELIGQEAFQERKARYDKALSGEVVTHEASRLMPDGRYNYFTITHKPHCDEHGNILGVMSLAIDITDRRAMEENLEKKGAELERSNRDLEQFAYIASHDLKAPLRAIEVLVEWLKEDLEGYKEGEVQENLGLLKQRTGRLNRLLDDLLTYSRAGRKVGDITVVDTKEMVEDIASLLGPPEGMKIEADAGLPKLTVHHAPLEQVLRNLINNAIKHHPDETGQIRVFAQDQGDSIMFGVEDDGAGIPEEYAERVFKMFQTLQPRDEKEGSGMGLAIVKRIIDWQGGRIWFHAGPGDKGTVFKFIWNKIPDVTEATEKDEDEDEPNDSRKYIAG